MSVVALHAPPRPTAAEDQRLEMLAEMLVRNRFLPEPPSDSIFVGDGDFRAIGAEFLRHFVRLGGLKPAERVLDIGSGIGRMAVPLTQYLDPETASYEGLDPVLEGISWCTRTITPLYPNFRFHRLDLAHPLYNPSGALPGDQVVLPFPDASFDFVAMVSVATHLPGAEISAYAREVARLLAPNGRLFMTAFVMDGVAREARPERDPRLAFARSEQGPDWHADPQAPLAAVAFDEGWLEAALAAAGLYPSLVSLGHWRGAPADHYQDVLIATKPGRVGA